MTTKYDTIVVGAGHAGCEAANASAKLGCKTLLVTMDMTKMAHMSCNPAVGGVAKGQIVREIDALGGQMGIITDKSTIQFRMLNRSKGPAMWSPRAQCDKHKFSVLWREYLENCDNLYLWQDNIVELIITNNKVTGVKTQLGIEFTASSVVLTNGTFLKGLIHVGRSQMEGGRSGDMASYGLSEQLKDLGFEVGRMKTGTPVRIDSRTVDYSQLVEQCGDAEPVKFSYLKEIEPVKEQKSCYLAYTSLHVHDTLREGFVDSPLFNGIIAGIGPRYCPSIEDKLRTFADKNEHQLFLEPEGATTTECYLNGFSSSLPWQVQISALTKIKGFENVHIFRPGYAIEYDFFQPTQLKQTLETKLIENLFFAGQINGTTGYEEAAAQGMIAGINASLKIKGEESFILGRDEAYIGVLIDDLVNKGVDEPYRMFTSRAEYRILLRQDNADMRLTEKAHKIGLVDENRYSQFSSKRQKIEDLSIFIKSLSVKPEELNIYLSEINSSPLTQKRKLNEVVVRNEIFIKNIQPHISALNNFITDNEIDNEVIEEVEILIKYGGYIEREKGVAEKLERLENIKISPDFDFNALQSITIEARQKLTRIKPSTIGQASRIPGVSPSDINVLLVYFGR
ncbi:MAG: tRNA uridine-5-carboxymethylaminomethyl(34) synthesis enzyme MnmG [Rikenellaceae bacterium]